MDNGHLYKGKDCCIFIHIQFMHMSSSVVILVILLQAFEIFRKVSPVLGSWVH